MSESITVEQLFHRAHLFITEGQREEALAVLDKIQVEDPAQRRELAYLRAWCSTLGDHWDEAAQFLLSADVNEEPVSDIQALGHTERRRRAHYLLLLGNIAVNLGRYEEATRHYTRCIKFLDERRMNDVNVRIKARYGLGTAYTQTGFYSVALAHYQDALRLCGEGSEHPELPHIYYGLCDAHRHLGNFELAFDYGKKALELYVARSDKAMEGRMYNLLGRICYQMREFQDASYYYTEALTLAMSANRPELIMNTLTALADVRLEEGRLAEARRYCEHALEYKDRVTRKHYLGMLFIVCGKVAEAEAKKAEGQLARELVDEAISWYQKAESELAAIEAKTELAEVYGRLAQILESSGQHDRAIAYWKSAYATYSGPEDALL